MARRDVSIPLLCFFFFFMEEPSFIKKEKDIFTLQRVKKEEEEGGGGDYYDEKRVHKKKRVHSHGDAINGLHRITDGYAQIEGYESINVSNTQKINTIIQELETYVYSMHIEGEISITLFEYCTRIIEATNALNKDVVVQTDNIKDFVLNAIAYNSELHDLYNEATKKKNGVPPIARRDASSIFNTVSTTIETMEIPNHNQAIKSTLLANIF